MKFRYAFYTFKAEIKINISVIVSLVILATLILKTKKNSRSRWYVFKPIENPLKNAEVLIIILQCHPASFDGRQTEVKWEKRRAYLNENWEASR